MNRRYNQPWGHNNEPNRSSNQVKTCEWPWIKTRFCLHLWKLGRTLTRCIMGRASSPPWQWTQLTQLTQLTQATQPTQATQSTRSTDKVLTSLNESSMRLSFCVKFFSHTYSCFPGAKSDKTSYVGLNWSIKQTASHLNNIDVVIVSTEGKWEKICALAVPSRRRRILFDRNPNLECRFHLNPPIRFLVSSCDPRGIMLRTFLREMNW